MSDIEIVESAEERSLTPEEEKRRANMGLFYEERLPELEPKSFHEGFTPRTILGALFVAIIMLPGSIYLFLFMGQGMGPAVQWMTIILFVEVARRSFTILRRQEIYLIYYLAGTVAAATGGFYGLIWNQFFRNSVAARQFNIADKIPVWISPPLGSTAYIERTFMHHDWLIPIGLMLAGAVLGRLQWIGMGYFLFRATSDVERLPFPMAPVAAQGATALAEVSADKESWRWPVFSTGTMVGLAYGLFYVFIPVLSGAFLLQPLQLIPIPFIDLTTNAESIFPTGRIGISTDLGAILMGFVLPFPIVVGGFISSLFGNTILTPTLYRHGLNHMTPEGLHPYFPNWRQGMGLLQTEFSMSVDLWLSVGIGTGFAVALIGFWTLGKRLLKAKAESVGAAKGKGTWSDIPAGRGDFPITLALLSWFIGTLGFVLIAMRLVPDFPVWIIFVFGFIWSPINSYVSARFIGMTGMPIGIPMLRQAVYILSKYPKIDIWFAPIPMDDHGWAAARFREVELTGTKMRSVIKAEAFGLFVVLLFSFMYWSFYWKLGEIPSSQYPFAQAMWPLEAQGQALWTTANLQGGANYLMKALKPGIIIGSCVGALGLSTIISALGIHYMWFYGLLGISGNTTAIFPTLFGALLSRYYMIKRFGISRWQLYAPVLLAGYACGIGLIGMLSIALTIIFKSVRVKPF